MFKIYEPEKNIEVKIVELKREVSRCGITKELKLQSYPKKSERKKAKEALAQKRRRRKERELQRGRD